MGKLAAWELLGHEVTGLHCAAAGPRLAVLGLLSRPAALPVAAATTGSESAPMKLSSHAVLSRPLAGHLYLIAT